MMVVVGIFVVALLLGAVNAVAADDDIPHLLICFEGPAYFRGFQVVAASAIAANANPYMVDGGGDNGGVDRSPRPLAIHVVAPPDDVTRAFQWFRWRYGGGGDADDEAPECLAMRGATGDPSRIASLVVSAGWACARVGGGNGGGGGGRERGRAEAFVLLEAVSPRPDLTRGLERFPTGIKHDTLAFHVPSALHRMFVDVLFPALEARSNVSLPSKRSLDC